jgi:hypothetical protein
VEGLAQPRFHITTGHPPKKNYTMEVCSVDDIIDSAACFALRPLNPQTLVKVKSWFQKIAYEKLQRQHDYDAEMRIRHKQKRWKLSCQQTHPRAEFQGRRSTPAWQAHRALHNLQLLGSLTTPRVRAAAFGTIWNRWATARRFQEREHERNVCKLRCSPSAEDSIEHYSRCSHAKDFPTRFLKMDPSCQVNLHTFNLCNPHINTQEDLVISALLIYAMYRATNWHRHHQEQPPQNMYRAFCQWAREGALNHAQTMRILDGRWSRHRPATLIPLAPALLTPLTQAQRKRPIERGDRNHAPATISKRSRRGH